METKFRTKNKVCILSGSGKKMALKVWGCIQKYILVVIFTFITNLCT